MDNKSAETYKNEGNTKYLAKEYEEAVGLYTTALELDPKNATYYANRAAAYSAMDKIDKALMDCNKAIELDPNYVKAYFRKAKCLLSMGDLVGAEQYFNQTLSKEPSNGQAKQELATIKNIKKSMDRGNEYMRKSEWSAAQYEFQSILAQCPDFTTARLNFAECLIGTKKYPEALKVISTVLHNNTQNVQGLYLRALVKYYQGELQPAVSILNTILIDLDPDNKKAFQLLKITKNMSNMKEKGNDFFKEGNMDEAINMYTKALEQDPNHTINHAILYHNLGFCYQRKQEYEKAVESLTKAIEIDDNYIKAYTKRAQCYTQLDKHEEAVRDYEMANLKAPSNEIKYLLKDAKKRAKIAARKDYYKIMGVSKTASDNEIRKAYLKLARDKHPDKVSNENREQADKEFKELQEAYGVLSDPEKRAKYDAGADLQEIENGSADFGFGGGHRGSPFGFGGFGGFGGGGFHFDPRDDFY